MIAPHSRKTLEVILNTILLQQQRRSIQKPRGEQELSPLETKNPSFQLTNCTHVQQQKQNTYNLLYDYTHTQKENKKMSHQPNQPDKPKITWTLEPVESIPELPRLKCLRCGHAWIQRKEKPKQCPKCKSPYWNKPRKKEVKT